MGDEVGACAGPSYNTQADWLPVTRRGRRVVGTEIQQSSAPLPQPTTAAPGAPPQQQSGGGGGGKSKGRRRGGGGVPVDASAPLSPAPPAISPTPSTPISNDDDTPNMHRRPGRQPVERSRPIVCRHWRWGFCEYGDRCKFRHIGPIGPKVRAPAVAPGFFQEPETPRLVGAWESVFSEGLCTREEMDAQARFELSTLPEPAAVDVLHRFAERVRQWDGPIRNRPAVLMSLIRSWEERQTRQIEDELSPPPSPAIPEVLSPKLSPPPIAVQDTQPKVQSPPAAAVPTQEAMGDLSAVWACRCGNVNVLVPGTSPRANRVARVCRVCGNARPQGEAGTPTEGAMLKARWEEAFQSGVCKPSDIDARARAVLATMDEPEALLILNEFSAVSRKAIKNKSAYLLAMVRRRHLEIGSRVTPQQDYKATDAPILDPSPQPAAPPSPTEHPLGAWSSGPPPAAKDNQEWPSELQSQVLEPMPQRVRTPEAMESLIGSLALESTPPRAPANKVNATPSWDGGTFGAWNETQWQQQEQLSEPPQIPRLSWGSVPWDAQKTWKSGHQQGGWGAPAAPFSAASQVTQWGGWDGGWTSCAACGGSGGMTRPCGHSICRNCMSPRDPCPKCFTVR